MFGLTSVVAHHLLGFAKPEVKASAKPKVAFVLGGPGAGKGSQCARMVEKYGFVHLSAGDLLRAERKSGSELADMINSFIVNGQIVPGEVTTELIKRAMLESAKESFLIDGFPRNQDNIDNWNSVVGDAADVRTVLFLDCAMEECTRRVLDRAAQGSGRNDDNIESLKKRFVVYETQSRPVYAYYGDLVQKVDAGRPIDDVFADVSKIIDATFA